MYSISSKFAMIFAAPHILLPMVRVYSLDRLFARSILFYIISRLLFFFLFLSSFRVALWTINNSATSIQI